MHFFFNFKAHVYCISAKTGQAEHDVTSHTRGVNQTAEPLKLTHRAPGGSIEPRLRTTAIEEDLTFIEEQLFL